MKSNLCRLMLVALVVVAASLTSHAQVLNSNSPTITLNASVAESLTVGLSGNSLTWAPLTPGSATNAGPSSITVTTTWVLRPSRTAVRLLAFFASSATALAAQTVGGVDIPTSAFQINSAFLGAPTAVTQTQAGFGGANAALLLRTTNITGVNKNSNTSDVLTFNIDLSGGTMPQLPADNYIGTLTIQAQATP